MTENIAIEGRYQTQDEHALQRSPLDEAIAGLEGAATRFSVDAIQDAQARSSYVANI